MAQRISQSGLDHIKSFEGLRLRAYDDKRPNHNLMPGDEVLGTVTIGYGHTRTAKAGMEITEAKAEALLRSDLEQAERDVEAIVHIELTPNQHAALVSFVFNLGRGKAAGSTLIRKLNLGDYGGAADEFEKWIFFKGKPNDGLKRRRTAERALFLKAE
jgi:lysozyme